MSWAMHGLVPGSKEDRVWRGACSRHLLRLPAKCDASRVRRDDSRTAKRPGLAWRSHGPPLDNLRAQKARETGDPNASTFLGSANDMLDTIDAVEHDGLEWSTYHFKYTGPITPERGPHGSSRPVAYVRNPLHVAEYMTRNPEFRNTWDYVPNKRYNKLADNPNIHGAMLTPVILGADKTTVSVATGHQEYHPVYMSPGNIHNTTQRAHGDAFLPIAFLAIPERGREKATGEFRAFTKQLYHAALPQILSPLLPALTTPHVMRCPNGHFRRAILELGPSIANYPEQVCLAWIVCRVYPDELDKSGPPRFRAHTDTFVPCTPWDVFGLHADVTPLTAYSPRADIHELLSPDLLHQLIEGIFKDHIVEWIVEYIRITADSEAEANRTIEQIDRRSTFAPSQDSFRRGWSAV
ncbi:hypothetical protein C8Q76DRAFT_803950 [Earliella scabrosa]|nr:hypothetical protein C8Q76DRAFT_803950 [Earliella scabrosa]